MEGSPQPDQPEALTEEQLIERWLRIGRRNPWIRHAIDPPFSRDSLHKCVTLEELQERLHHGNWCLGQGFYYQDLCFIQQVEAGDEWLTIKGAVPFESISWLVIERQQGKEGVTRTLERLLSLTPEQCNLGWSEGL
jgi:hypothetical protein